MHKAEALSGESFAIVQARDDDGLVQVEALRWKDVDREGTIVKVVTTGLVEGLDLKREGKREIRMTPSF